MDLGPKHYLLIYALIVTPVVISFFFIRRNQSPSRLNLNPGPSRTPVKPEQAPPAQSDRNSQSHTRTNHERRAKDRGAEARASEAVATEKSLNVFFNWNGHAWDAFEALGIPAGSSVESASAAYQRLLTHGEPDDLLFFKAAFEAILKSASGAK